MSTVPEGEAAGQRGGTQHDTPPGAPPQADAPSQEQYSGTARGQVPAQTRGQQPARGTGVQPERMGPVPRAQTRVTGRRVVQYLIDAFLIGIIPSLISIPFDNSNSTAVHVIGGIVTFVIFVAISFGYWVLLTHRLDGQTPAMKLLGLRVISKGGGRANIAQLSIRWICLIVDAIPYTWPFTGLVGFIVILCSRDRQRIGDHLARTLVIATDGRGRGGDQYAGTDTQYEGTDPRYTGTDQRYAGTDPRYAGTDTQYPRTDTQYTGADTSQPPTEPRQQGMEAQQPPPRPDQPGMQPGQPGTQPGQPGTQSGQPGTQPGQPGTGPAQS
jgi:uncharacterized RDD family membrane protein YckC